MVSESIQESRTGGHPQAAWFFHTSFEWILNTTIELCVDPIEAIDVAVSNGGHHFDKGIGTSVASKESSIQFSKDLAVAERGVSEWHFSCFTTGRIESSLRGEP